MSFKKNTAVTGFAVGLVSATDGSDITTGTPVGYYTLDGGTQTAIADTTPTHEGNGLWTFDLTAGEMNGDIVGLTFTHASAITAHFTIKTDTKIVSDLQDLTAAQVNAECDTALTDYDAPTKAELDARTLLAANYFDPSTDQVIVSTNNDKSGYTISGTKTTLDALNDIADTDIVSAGPITTLAGAVVNVDLVDTTTTNTDMRGTDSANTVAPDNTGIANIQTQIGTAGAGLTDLGGMSAGMKAEVNAEADTALADYDGPTNAEMEARTPTAAQLAYIVANAATGMPVTFTTTGGSTTAAVLNQVDGVSASATNDQYNGRLLVFTSGTLKGVVTDITDYVGSTTTATITAIPFAPTSSHNARLI